MLRHFKSLEVLLKMFIWANSRHKLSWGKLKNPTDLGGTALPDLNMYHLAAQISQLFHIVKTDRARFLTFLCPKWSHSTGEWLLQSRGGVRGSELMGDRTSLLYHYRCIWDIVTDKLLMHEHTPLWHNVTLPEFCLIPDSKPMEIQGFFLLISSNPNGELKPFDRLRSE